MGALLIAAACLAWGIDNNLTRKLSSADPVQIAMLKGLVAGTVNLALAARARARRCRPPARCRGGAVVGFLGFGVSLVLFVLALRHLGTARTGAYFSLAPFIGAVLAVGLLGEPLTTQLAVAGVLMALGLWLHLAERHEHEHQHEALEHEHRTSTTSTTSMPTAASRRASRTRTGIATRRCGTSTRTTPTCTTATSIDGRNADATGGREERHARKRLDQRLARSAGVGQPSTGRPSRDCSWRTASRVLVPRMPSMPPTS